MWEPLVLVRPDTTDIGNGNAYTHLNPHRDYIARLPPYAKTGTADIDGGHNVVIIGASIRVAPDSGVQLD